MRTPGIRLGFRSPAASGRIRPWRVGLRGLLVLALAAGSLKTPSGQVLPAATEEGIAIVGTPQTLGMGITETVDQIMRRQAKAPRPSNRPTQADRGVQADLILLDDPKAPAVAQWPPSSAGEAAAPPSPGNPQAVGTGFQAVSLAPPNFPESGSIPPDSMGDVGPSQILVGVNGRIKVFDKTGVLGDLDSDMDVFFNSVRNGFGTTDPQVRYDRLSGRWFVTIVNLTPFGTPNRVLLAVSSGPTITGAESFTFFFFTVSDGGGGTADNTAFCDYPSLGVDANALYIGCNLFTSPTTFLHTTGFVVRKSSVLGGGPLVVTAFRDLTGGVTAGPYAPRGVDNDDPQATEGYFIGADIATLSRLQIRRVSSPGGTPSISGNITLVVPTTTNMSRQLAPGATTQTTGIDASDIRLFQASIHKNKITGVSSLWTAHVLEVDTTCTAAPSNTRRRIGARWHEIGTLTTAPALVQSGTLCNTVSGSPTVNSERGYLFPSVVETGQGHMALGASYASLAEFAGVAVSGRLRTDPLGTTQPATVAQTGLGTYQLCDGPAGSCPRNRWGDYSFTDVDPNDDQTVWTFQEYALDATGTGFNGDWAIRATQLLAPPPATPSGASPSSVCQGLSSVNVAITGTSSSGSEFFDPGPDTGGPGYANHVAGSTSGGVVVNGASFTDVTHVSLNLDTTGASAGAKSVTITNPDGQSAMGSNLLTINPSPAPPTAANNGPICAQGTLNLSASTVAGATYLWTGPNGFSSSAQNPSIPNATTTASGAYSVTVTVGGCTSAAAMTTATVIAGGSACTDGNPCTVGDTCVTGACQPGAGLLDTDGDTHADGACGGDDCSDADAQIWGAPIEVDNLQVLTESPANLSWNSQGTLVGPGTLYDLVSGALLPGGGISLSPTDCLQNSTATSYSDTRPDPVIGEGYWMAVRARNSCGTGTYGTPQRDSSIPACP